MGIFDFLSPGKRTHKNLQSGDRTQILKGLEEVRSHEHPEEFTDDIKGLVDSGDRAVATEAALWLADRRIEDGAGILARSFAEATSREERCRILEAVNRIFVPGLELDVLGILEALAAEPVEEELLPTLVSADLDHSLFFQCCQYLKLHLPEGGYERLTKVWEQVERDPSPVRGYLVAEALLLMAPEDTVPLIETLMRKDHAQSSHGVDLLAAAGSSGRINLMEVLTDSSRVNFLDSVLTMLQVAGKDDLPLLFRTLDRLENSLQANNSLRVSIRALQEPPAFLKHGMLGCKVVEKIVSVTEPGETREQLREYVSQEALMHFHKRFKATVERALSGTV